MKDRDKFRLWNIAEKKYDISCEVTLGEQGFLWMADIRTGGYAVNDKYILEFCMGAKDKHDRLIFDGDIIRECWYEDWKENPVVFHDFHDCAVIEWAEAYSGFQWCAVDVKGHTTDFYGGIPENCVIIGNRNEDSLEELQKTRISVR